MLSIDMIMPAAGIGKRMGSAVPKQYLKIFDQTVLEYTVKTLLASPYCNRVIVAIRRDDPYFCTLPVASHPKVKIVEGGEERVNSVLNALAEAGTEWVLVHDAARPCLSQHDLTRLIEESTRKDGGILGCAVRDTMKRTNQLLEIQKTEDRSLMFHALTPQLFRREQLIDSINRALSEGVAVTDESSAMEFAGFKPLLVEGRSDNIKITQPADLKLAEFIINSMIKG